MSRTYDALRRAETRQPAPPQLDAASDDPFRVLCVTSPKGGVGKTTLATNLAVYLRALREDLPILLLTLDEQPMLERMFALDAEPAEKTVLSALREGSFAGAMRLGQYGIHFVPSSQEIWRLKTELRGLDHLRLALQRSGWRGLVIVDTKSDLELLTQNALAAADLSIVVVKDQASLIEARRVFSLLREWERPEWRARLLVSLVDLRIKFAGEEPDILSLIQREIRRHHHPFFETFVSRSPKIESLYTNPEGRAHAILHAASGTVVDRQLRALAREVWRQLEVVSQRAPSPPPPAAPDTSLREFAAELMPEAGPGKRRGSSVMRVLARSVRRAREGS